MAAVTADQFHDTKYFGFLDGMRAIAALLVVTVHVRGDHFAWLQGQRGVGAFFMLSGFLITTLALREEGRFGDFSYKAFFLRRVFRILPLYYIALFATGFVVLVGLDDRSEAYLAALPYNLFYFQEYPIFSMDKDFPFSVAWTLGIEEKFYVVWPLVGFLLLRRWGHRLAAAVVIMTAPLLAPDAIQGYVLPYSAIAMGVVMALCFHERRIYTLVARFTRDWMVYAAVVLVFVVMPVKQAPTLLDNIVSPATVLVLLVCLTTRSGTYVHTFLTSRPMAALGRISYAIYLFHLLFMDLLERWFPETLAGDLATMFLGAGITIGLGFVLYRWVEHPLIEYGRRLAARSTAGRQERPATSPAAAT